MNKKFKKNNESFTCVHCGKHVGKHPTSSRDHCNHCLYGLHVDIYPGDRLNPCRGLLKPLELEIKNGKEKVLYKCEKCGQEVKNITAPDDDREEVLKLA